MSFAQHPMNPDVHQVEHNGTVFDVPSWIEPGRFQAGLESGDDLNPFSSLVALEYIRSEEVSHTGDSGEQIEYEYDIFKAQWFVPFGAIRELLVGWRTQEFGLLAELNGDRSLKYEITKDGALITAYASAPNNTISIYSMLLPRDESAIDYHEYNEDVNDSDHLAEVVEAIISGETPLSEKVDEEYYEELTAPNGERYFFLTNIAD